VAASGSLPAFYATLGSLPEGNYQIYAEATDGTTTARSATNVFYTIGTITGNVKAGRGYTNDFSAQPGNEWTMRAIGSGGTSGSGEVSDATGLDTAVQTNAASMITGSVAGATGSPPSASSNAVSASAGYYLQTRPTGCGATLLMAAFTNSTGTNATSIRIIYDYVTNRVAGTAEEVRGHRVYYSLSGAASSWVNIAPLSQTTQTVPLTAAVTLADTWTNGTKLYLLWADDNGSGSGDDANDLDNFFLTVTGGSPLYSALACTLNLPTNGAVFTPSQGVGATATVSGGASPYVVTFWTNVNGGAFGLASSNGSVASGGAVGTTYGTFPLGTYSTYVMVVDTNGTGTTVYTATNNYTVVTPLSVTLSGPANGASFDRLVNIGATCEVSGGTSPYTVRFYTNSVLVGLADGSSGSTYYKSLGTFAVGATPAIRATVTDAKGWVSNSAVSAITITGPLSVTLTSPTGGASFGAPAAPTLTANVYPGVGATAAGVGFYDQSIGFIGTALTVPFTTASVALNAGSYSVYAIGTNSLGETAFSSTNAITVTNVPLSVTLDSPANGNTFNSPATVTYQATPTAGSSGTVSSVAFYIISNSVTAWLYTATTSPYSNQVTSLADGTYGFFAVVTNSLSTAAFSSTNTVTVSSVASGTVALGPYISSRGETNVTIRWRTSESTNGTVRYGTSTNSLTSLATDATISTTHTVTLTGLTPETQYYYSLGVPAGTIRSSTNYHFSTAAVIGSPRPTRIWWLSDFGNNDSTQTTIRDKYLNFAATNGHATDVWLGGGDNEQADTGAEANYITEVFNIYSNFMASTPFCPTVGNHDGGSSSAYWTLFHMPTAGQCGGYASGSQHYYSYDFGNVHFIALDAYNNGSGAASYTAELTWLTNDLQNTTNEWIIAYWHQPPYCNSTYISDSDSFLKATRENFNPVLEQYGADLVMSGHCHVLQRTYLINKHYGINSTWNATNKIAGGLGREDNGGPYYKTNGIGTVYATAPSGCSLAHSDSAGMNCFATTLSASIHGCLIVDVNTNRLDFKCMGSDGSFGDYFTLIHYAEQAATPAIVLATPTNATVYVSSQTVYATATVSGGTSPYVVKFWTNDPVNNPTAFAQAGATVSTSPYWTSFDAPSVNSGYKIYATVTDQNGSGSTTNSATNSFTVAAPISITLSAPANGGSFDRLVSIGATCTVSGGTSPYIVRFYTNGILFGTADGNSASTYYKNLGTFAVGTTPAIQASATDASGWVSNSTVSTITITGPMSVSLSSPSDGGSYAAPATVTLTASAYAGGSGTISGVGFFDATSGFLASALSSPYSTSAGFSAGVYRVYAVATNSLGPIVLSSTNTITVTNVPTFVTLSSPAGGASYGVPSSVTLAASASPGSIGTITGVGFFDATNGWLASDLDSPYSTSATLSAGLYRVYAVATNSSTELAYSGTNTITVTNIPLSVTLNSPTNGNTFSSPANVSYQASPTAGSSGTISGVAFYVIHNSVLTWLHTATSSPYSNQVTGLTDGSYAFFAVVTNSLSVTAFSSTNTITVSSGATTNWVAYNTLGNAGNSKAKVSNWSPTSTALSTNGGPLTNYYTGIIPTNNGTSVGMYVGVVASTLFTTGGSMTAPTNGAASTNVFNASTIMPWGTLHGVVFGASPYNGAVTCTFSNLNPAKKYVFAGTATRGSTYARWTLVTISDASSYTPMHLPGPVGTNAIGSIVTNSTPTYGGGLLPNQALFNFGDNRQGDVCCWSNIVPSGPNNSFTVTCSNWRSVSNISCGMPVGPVLEANYTYAFEGVLLAEVETGAGALNIALNAPTNTSVFVAGTTLSATATVANGTAPYTVVFYTNGVGAVTNTGTGSQTVFNADLSGLAAGTYQIYAQVTDSATFPTTANSATNTVYVAEPITITLTDPVNGAEMDRLVNVGATCTIAGGRSPWTVRFYTNGVSAGAADGNSGLTYYKSLGLFVVGSTNTVYASATDASGWVSNSTVSTIHITGPMSVTLSSPAGGGFYGAPASVTLSANAFGGGDATITGVGFYDVVTGLIASDLAYPYSAISPALDVGTYQIYAVATNSLNATAVSGTNTITVTNVPLSIALDSPTNGNTFSSPANVTCQATPAAGSSGTIGSVAFFVISNSVTAWLFTDSGSPYSNQVAGLTDGTYAFFAVVTNSFNAVAFSSTNTITVSSTASGTVTREPYLGNRGETNILIRWRTSESTVGRVRYGTSSSSLNLSADDTSTSTDHSVTLTGLTPETKYYYSIGIAAGTVKSSTNYYFSTAPPIGSPRPTRVWYISDYGAGTSDSVQPVLRDNYLNYTRTNGHATDVWVSGGDNQQSAMSSTSDSLYQTTIFDVYSNIFPNTPFFPTCGNHDGSSGLPYWTIFSMPTSGQCGGYASGSQHYYSYDYGNVHFISLDAFNNGSGVASYTAELTWLTNDLQNTTNEWIIAYWHQPPYCNSSYISDSDSILKATRENFNPVLEQYGADLVMSGHCHVLQRTYLINKHYGVNSSWNATNQIAGGLGREDNGGAYYKTNGIGTVYATSPSACSLLHSDSAGMNCFATTLSASIHGCLVIDLNTNRLDFKCMATDGSIGDYFTLIHYQAQAASPAIVLASPTNGAVCVTGQSISATATVSGGSSPYVVKFWTNDPINNPTTFAQAGATVSSSPYWTFFAAPAVNSGYKIHATVTDQNGAGTTAYSATNSYTVAAPISITLTDPANGGSFDRLVNVGATCTVSGGTSPYTVRFYTNGVLAGAADGNSSSIYYKSLGTFAFGSTLAVQATATDASGWVSNSTTSTVTITGPMSVTLGSPADGASYAAPASVTLSANAYGGADATISGVGFYEVTTGWLGSDLAYPYSLSAALNVGTYRIYAVATNNLNVTAISSTNTITVVYGATTNWVAYNTFGNAGNNKAKVSNWGPTSTALGTVVGGPVTNYYTGLIPTNNGTAVGMYVGVVGANMTSIASQMVAPTNNAASTNVFNASTIIPWGALHGNLFAPYGSFNGALTYTFTNLNPAKKYVFAGSATRGSSFGRWTVVTITDASSSTPMHIPGPVGTNAIGSIVTNGTPVYGAGVLANQALFNFADNRQGDVCCWSNIVPSGADNSFTIICSNWRSVSNLSCGMPVGPAQENTYTYAFEGMLLAEVEPAAPASPVSLTLNTPADNALFVAGTTVSATATVANGTAPYTVIFYTNGVGAATNTGTGSQTVFNTDLTGLASGSYQIYAQATDTSGARAYSATNTLLMDWLPGMGPVAAWTLKNTVLTLQVSKLLSRASDPDGDVVSIVAVSANSTNGGTVALGFGTITYTPVTDFVGYDQFTFTLSDGWGGVFTNTVDVTVAAANAGTLNLIGAPRVVGGRFEVGFAGVPGQTYTIEWKALLTDPWQKLTNCTAPASGADIGVIRVSQPTGSAEIGSRFYRTVYPSY
jgi:acid phosphatase type 7